MKRHLQRVFHPDFISKVFTSQIKRWNVHHPIIIFINLVFLFMISTISFVKGDNVTELGGFYKNGQVFLIWTNGSHSNNYYKVYRSASPITNSSQLSSCEYLGWTNQYSAKDHDLSAHYGQDHYLRIDSGGSELASTKG